MKINVFSRTGHFNFANPSEESINTTIQLYDDKEMIGSCSIATEYEVRGRDFDYDNIAEELAQMIEDYQKRLWLSSSRERDLKFAKLLRKNKKAIAKGNKQARKEELLKQKEQIESELSNLL